MLLDIRGVTANSLLTYIRRCCEEAMQTMAEFHHLRLKMRVFNKHLYEEDSSAFRQVVVEAYGESEGGDIKQRISNTEIFSGVDLNKLMHAACGEIMSSLDTDVFIRMSPRVSLILQNTPFSVNVEILFLNINIVALMDVLIHQNTQIFDQAYPGLDMDVLIRPLEYQTPMSVKDIDRSAFVPHNHQQETSSPANDQLMQFMQNSVSSILANAQAQQDNSDMTEASDMEEVHVTADPDAYSNILRILHDRGNDRSPFNNKDNDMQQKISQNKLDDSSKNIPEIIPDEVVDDDSVVPGAQEATDTNLDEMFDQGK